MAVQSVAVARASLTPAASRRARRGLQGAGLAGGGEPRDKAGVDGREDQAGSLGGQGFQRADPDGRQIERQR
jgi:hypothetical protein